MPGWFAFFLSLLFILLEGVLLALCGWEQFTFQLGLAIVIVVAMTRDFVSGGLVVGFLLYPIEWSVGGVPGYYAFALVALFFLLRPLKDRVVRLVGIETILVGAAASLVHAGAMIVTLALTQPTSPVIPAIVSNMFGATLMVGVSTWCVAWCFRVIDRKFKPVSGNQLELDL